MRRASPFLLFLLCVGCPVRPAQDPTDEADEVGSTHVDGVDLALDLPGRWKEVPDETGHVLEKGTQMLSLASLQIHPLATVCPSAVLEQATAGGACLEAASLGQGTVERCGQALVRRGWRRDDAAAVSIGHDTAKKLDCYRRPQRIRVKAI